MAANAEYPLASGYRSVARYVLLFLVNFITITNIEPQRLNLQHHLWTQSQQYLLHPGIPNVSRDEIKVADIGTGTGIWLLDVRNILPTSARLHGFDINLSQCPPQSWLPNNVSMHILDIHDDLPTDLQGQYGNYAPSGK